MREYMVKQSPTVVNFTITLPSARRLSDDRDLRSIAKSLLESPFANSLSQFYVLWDKHKVRRCLAYRAVSSLQHFPTEEIDDDNHIPYRREFRSRFKA